MAITRVQYTSYTAPAKSLTHTLTLPTTTAGNLVVIGVGWNEEAVITTATASGGSGSWVSAIGPVEHQSTSNPQIKGQIFYKQNAADQAGTLTITLSNSRNCTIHFAEYSGVSTTGALDVTASSHGSSTTLDSGTSSTTSTANELWLGFLACKNVNAQSIVVSAGWSQVGETGQASGGGAADRSGLYQKIASGTGTANVQATISVSADWVGMVATFTQASAAASLVQLTAQGAQTSSTLLGGVGNRTNSNNSNLVSSNAKYPNIDLSCFYAGWATLEPNAPISATQTSGMSWTNFEAAVESCIGYGKRILLRIECGYRCPAWLYTTSINPCTKLFLVDENGNNSAGASANNVYIPLPWTSSGSGTPNANLIVHYTRLLKEVQKEMVKSDGHGGLIGDHVYFMAVSMPTWVGTEMSMGYQSATAFAGTYDGPSANVGASPTYKSINTAEWNNYGTEANRRVWYLDAWDKACDLHMTNLPAIPSSVAYGTSFGAYTDQRNRAVTLISKYGRRIAHMTTNLQVDSVGGTYALADGNGAATILAAKNAGGWVGFQCATESRGYPSPNTDALAKSATDDAIATYGATYFEPADPLLGDIYAADAGGSGWLGIEAFQARILAQGGVATGGVTAGLTTPTAAVMTAVTTASIPYAADKFTRSVAAGGLGTADVGGTYTLTGTAADFSVDGSSAVILVKAAAQTKTAALASVLMDDEYPRITFQADKAPVGSFFAVDVYPRYVDASNKYQVRAICNTNGAITLQVSSVVAGVTTALSSAASTGLTWQSANDFTLIAGATNTTPTTVTAYLFDSSSPPPSPVPWTVQLDDTTSALQVSAPVAFSCLQNTGSTAGTVTFKISEWDSYPARPASSAAISVDASLSVARTQNKTGTGRAWPHGPQG